MSDFLDNRKAQHMMPGDHEGSVGTVEGVPPPPGLEGVSDHRIVEPTDADRPTGASWWGVKYWKWMGPRGPEAVFCFACHGTFRGSWYSVAVPIKGEKDGLLVRPLLEGGLMHTAAEALRACWCPLGGRRYAKVMQRATEAEATEAAEKGWNR
jgi:hypothetical protein